MTSPPHGHASIPVQLPKGPWNGKVLKYFFLASEVEKLVKNGEDYAAQLKFMVKGYCSTLLGVFF